MRTRRSVRRRAALRENRRRQRRRRLGRFLVALVLSLLSAGAAEAQDPAPIPPPPAPKATPAPEATLWTASFDAGPSSVSTNQELKPYASVRATLVGVPWQRVRVGAQGRADRTTNGAAFSMQDFKSFQSAEALAFGLYRIKNSPVSVGAVGSLSWSVESGIKSLRDPNLWSFGGMGCIERFAWWPNGGLACLGVGRWSGRDGVRVSVTQPVKGEVVAIAVDFDVPFRKLPEFIRALPGAAQVAPLTGPPTAEQIRGVAQRLPISVKVGALVRLKGFEF